jgi:hypothetical protein
MALGKWTVAIDVQQNYASSEEHRNCVSKPVSKFSLDGEFIKEYPSIRAAGRGEGIKACKI